jgi:glyoxylase-like metal-dependent hydrolase (beta-lactamase superfamily II)
MQPASYAFKLGAFECTILKDAVHTYENPAKLLFYNAPRGQLKKVLNEHEIELGRWREWLSPYVCMLVKTGSHNVLVDTGIGSTFPPAAGELLRQLKALTVEPDDIDVVLITHAHGDHCGGNADPEGRAAFKRARYIMQKAEWDYWTSESVLAQPQNEWMTLVVQKNFQQLCNCFELIEGDREVVPGIDVISTPGHTPGHMAVRLSSNGERLWYMSDAFLHPVHIMQPDWYAEVDTQPEQAAATRKLLLKQASTGQTLVQCFHFPFPGLGHIIESEEGYRWLQLLNLV